jgi:hypothetical protein
LEGDTITPFEIVNSIPFNVDPILPPPSGSGQSCSGPDLISEVNLSANQNNFSSCQGSYGNCIVLVAGQSVSGTIKVTNQGDVTSPATILHFDAPDGSTSIGSFSIPSLSSGASYQINLPQITFSIPGGTYVASTADFNSDVTECDEFNNSNSHCIIVLPNLLQMRSLRK